MEEINVKDLELKSLIGFDGNPLNGLILHPDGVHLIYPLGTNVTTYNWSTKVQRFFVGLTNIISAVTVSSTGKYVAAGQVNYMGFRSPIIIWDFQTGEVVTNYESHMVRVESVAFSCCEQYLISLGGIDDGSIIVYEIEEKEVLCGSSSVKSTAGISTVLKAVNSRNRCFVMAGDNILRLWTLNREQRNLQGLDTSFAKIKRKILCTEIDRLDEYAYCGTSTGDVLKIKLNFPADLAVQKPSTSPTLVGCFAKYPKPGKKQPPGITVELYSRGVTSLRLYGNDGTMIVGSGNGVVELVRQKVQLKQQKKHYKKVETRLAAPTHPLLVTVLSANVESTVTSIQLMENHTVLVGTINCELFTVSVATFAVTRMFTCHTSAVFDLAFPRDYSKVFATASKNDVRVWSVDTLQELLRVTVPNCSCSGVLFSHDGSQIISSWNDGRIRSFTPESGRLLYTIHNCHNNGVSAIAICKDGMKLVSGGGDGQVRVWQVNGTNGTLIAVLKEHKGAVTSIDLHRLGHEAITSSADGTCIVWDIVRYTRLTIMFSSTVFTSAMYHPNSAQLLTSGTNRYVGFWEALDGSLIREIEGSAVAAINSLDITPTGKYFVTGSSDQTVKVWLYNEGVPTHVGVGHAGVVTNVRVSPDGQYLVSTSVDGGIFLWCFPHDPDTPPPSSRCSAVSGVSAGEQQTIRSRQLSLKKSMSVKKENISDISSGQKVISVLEDGGAAGDGDAAKAGGSGGPRICKSSSSIR
ncbi:cilia- and flagella-associated protein 52-like [Acyrthosiphon pisum]|uniref:Cilia- and flagella-associated protein 52 n=1 Tax=Acyrthosiphon pisum TaxID=7029 RepID=A0A8R2A1U6_ACYPI|nr:cilia- and flagella-associated protein 52-like [Acyrthosiphon pisum]|eukprot:XP_001948904.2 PREDICTED: cilia- and flagella-associated protein 52-like [Acyrthosiphon pisum]